MADPTYGQGFVSLQPQLAKGFAANLGSQMTGAMGPATKALAGLAIGAGVVKGLGAAVGSAIAFETAFTGVIKTVDATDEQLDEFKQGIIDMSTELGTSTTEIAAVAEAAGALGISTGALMEFTRVMVDLGNTTNLSADDAATSLAQFANITQLAETDFENLGSTLVGLGNAGASTESQIADMALRLAGAGTQIGLTQQEILAFASSLASVGIEAEAGGSAFSRVMVDMFQAVRQGGDELAIFAEVAGTTTTGFADSFNKDAAGALISFTDGLDRMATTGQDVFGTLESLGFDDIRVRDALLRAAGAGDLFSTSLDQANTLWEENTALADEANLRYGTTESQLNQIKARLTETGRELGEELLPTMLTLAEAGISLADAFEPVISRIDDVALGIEILVRQFQEITTGNFSNFDTFTDALVNISEGMDAGEDATLLFKNNLASLGRTVNVTGEDLKRLQREAGLSDTAMVNIGQSFLETARSGEDVGFTVDEIISLFQELGGFDLANTGPDEFSEDLAALGAAGRDAAGGITGVGTAADGVELSEAETEVAELSAMFDDAAIAGEGLRTVLQKIADPVFAAVTEFTSYKDLLKTVNEDGKVTAEEQFKIAEAVLGLGATFQSVGPDIGMSLDVVAAAMGTTREDVIADLEKMGIDVDVAAGTIGAGITDGILAGTDDLAEQLAARLNGSISDAMTDVQTRQGIHSPSSVWLENVGVPIADAIPAAWEQQSSTIQKTITGVLTDAQEAAVQAAGADGLRFDGLTSKLRSSTATSLRGADFDPSEMPARGGFNIENLTVHNPIGEPTEESLASPALAAAVAGLVR